MTGSEPFRPTRRGVLTGAGLAIAGGVAATVAGTPAVAEAAAQGVARARQGATAVEFRGRITQSGSSGQDFSALGILTALAGAQLSDLFEGSGTTIGNALFTVTANGSLVRRVLDQSVHALDIAPVLPLVHRQDAGDVQGSTGAPTSTVLRRSPRAPASPSSTSPSRTC